MEFIFFFLEPSVAVAPRSSVSKHDSQTEWEEERIKSKCAGGKSGTQWAWKLKHKKVIFFKLTKLFFFRHLDAKNQTFNKNHVHPRWSPTLIHRLWSTELIENSTVFSYISERGKTAKLATTHTQSAQERGANHHPSHTRLHCSFCSLFSGTKTPNPLRIRLLDLHSHTLTIKRTRPLKALSASNKQKPCWPALSTPPAEPLWQGSNKHTRFFFVSFVQLLRSVHLPQLCQLKTCVSC